MATPNNETFKEITVDAVTGEITERLLTDEEIAALPQPVDLPDPE